MSIKENALIVSVNVEMPTKARTDKKAIDEVAKKFGVAAKSIDMRKSLYPKELLMPIDNVVYKARQHCACDTYMWARGEFLLPSTEYMEFASTGGDIELEFLQNVTAFFNNWSNVLLGAEKELAGLYDAGLYPSLEELRQQFSLKFKYRQVTDEQDFRVSMQQEELDDLRARTEADTIDRMAGLQRTPIANLKKTLDILSAKLDEPMREIKDEFGNLSELRHAIFRNSTVDNITDECKKIIMFGDSVIGTNAVLLANRIKDSLPDPDHIRSREASRTMAHVQAHTYSKECDDLMASMRGQWEVPVVAVNPMGLVEEHLETGGVLGVKAYKASEVEPVDDLQGTPTIVKVEPPFEPPASIQIPPVEATVIRSESQVKIDTLEQEINDMFG